MTFDPSNALRSGQGFFSPNLVAIGHFYGRLTPGWPLTPGGVASKICPQTSWARPLPPCQLSARYLEAWRNAQPDTHTDFDILVILEHLQLHNGLQHWLHSMALRISKLFYLWLTPADPSKIFDPINALHSGLGSFLPIFGGHRAFLRNLTSGWPWLTRVWPLTPAMHYTLVMGSFHQIWWP